MTATAPARTKDPESTEEKGLGSDAWIVTSWTLISRLTGFIRIAAAGAILGPTVLSNIYQATTVLPNIAYNLMAGSLVVSLVVPAIVGHLGAGDTKRASRLAGSFLGVVLTAALVMGALIVVARPMIVGLLTLGADADGADSRVVAGYLLLLVVPQIALYGLASIGMAAQNAQGRFALAAAAPVAENVVVIASIAVFAIVGGGGLDTDQVTPTQLMLLGVGSTAAVVVHAALQWWGAATVGIVLVPRFNWRNSELRAMVRKSGPAVATAMAQALIYFVLIVGAGTVPGGVIALQLASQTIQLPIALGARPVAVALLPRLSRHREANDELRIIVDYREGLWLGGLTAVPAAVGLIVFAPYIASTIAVGRMSVDSAVALVEVALVALALSVVGVALAEVGRVALFADGNFTTPAVASWIQVAIVVGGVGLASLQSDPVLTLAALTVAATVGELVAGGVIQRAAIKAIRGEGLLATSLASTVAIAVTTLTVGGVIAFVLSRFGLPDLLVLLIGGTLGSLAYGVFQYRFTPSFRRLVGGVLQAGSRGLRILGGDLARPVLAGAAAIVAVNILALFVGWMAPLALIGLAITAVVWVKPAVAVYLYVGTVPFLAGMERGALLPEIRPNEAVLFILVGILLARGFWSLLLGQPLQLRPVRLDIAVIVFIAFGSIFPILVMLARGIRPEIGDLLEPLVLWRLLAIYLLVRATIRSFDQLKRVLAISLSVSAVVAVVAVLQGIGLLGSAGETLLVTLWGPEDVLNTGRASATLASSLATGGYLAYSLGIAVAWWGTAAVSPSLGGRRLIPPLVVLLLLGGLAAGQFSSWVAVLIAGPVAAYRVGKLGLVVRWATPFVPVALIVTWPVLSGRLSEFSGPFGMPRSWIGRIDNISTFYIPPLTENFGFVLGVRPNSVLEAPEQWREEIFLESGLLWLLWVGGIPLFLAFVWFMIEASRSALDAARQGATTGIIGAATVAAIACLLAVTVIDKHLQLRGAGDLLFVMLPLTLVGLSYRASAGGAGRQLRGASL